jgi:hypothetical protein
MAILQAADLLEPVSLPTAAVLQQRADARCRIVLDIPRIRLLERFAPPSPSRPCSSRPGLRRRFHLPPTPPAVHRADSVYAGLPTPAPTAAGAELAGPPLESRRPRPRREAPVSPAGLRYRRMRDRRQFVQREPSRASPRRSTALLFGRAGGPRSQLPPSALLGRCRRTRGRGRLPGGARLERCGKRARP